MKLLGGTEKTEGNDMDNEELKGKIIDLIKVQSVKN